MPSHHCKHPTCPALLSRPGYCRKHEHLDVPSEAKRAADKRYDREQRDRVSAAFYQSAEWRATREQKLRADPFCQLCGRTFATEVHHTVPIRTDWSRRLDATVLQSLCKPCHSRIEAREAWKKRRRTDDK